MNHTSPRQKIGLLLAGLLSLTAVPSVLTPTPDGEVGPPLGILILGTVLGIVGLVAVVAAWRGNRPAVRVAAGAVILNMLTSLPAFFVDVPAWLKLLVGVSVLISITSVALMFSPARRPVPVLD